MDESIQAIISDLIKTMIKSCDTIQGLLNKGVLTLIVNNGLVYTIETADIIPMDKKYTINFRNGSGPIDYTYNPDIEFQFPTRLARLLSTPPIRGREPVFVDENIGENPLFMEMRNSKATEGTYKFVIDPYVTDYKIITYIYKGIFNLNKADKISLEVYDHSQFIMPYAPNGTYLLFSYNIYKTKLKKSYNIMYCIFNLWRARKNQ